MIITRYPLKVKAAILLSILILIVIFSYSNRPQEKIVYRNEEGYPLVENLNLDNYLSRGPGFKNHLADILGSSLNLDWYKITIYDTTKVTNMNEVGCVEKPLVVLTKFLFYSSSTPKSFDGYKSDFIDNEKYLMMGEKASFIMSTNDEYSLSSGPTMLRDCTWPKGATSIITPELQPGFIVTAEPLWESWWAKLSIVVILGISLFASILQILTWYRRD